MPTAILAAVPPFQVVGRCENHVPFRGEVIIVGGYLRTVFLGWLRGHLVWGCVEESVFLKKHTVLSVSCLNTNHKADKPS